MAVARCTQLLQMPLQMAVDVITEAHDGLRFHAVAFDVEYVGCRRQRFQRRLEIAKNDNIARNPLDELLTDWATGQRVGR